MRKELSESKIKLLRDGTVIPAHPLALDGNRKLNEKHQRALTRYYIDAGAGGVAVGVHSTQFEIRNPEFNLYEPVLRLVAEEVNHAVLRRPFLKIAGVCGPVDQAVKETTTATRLGYDMVLLSMGGLDSLSEEQLLERTRIIADIMPVFGFYLQPAAGGRILSYDFWKSFADIPNVLAIKTAPFNRYQTLDVVRAVCASSRNDEISIYTGNDDNIINDLLTTYRFNINGKTIEKDIVGGLLGHWAVWTKRAVDLLAAIKLHKRSGEAIDTGWLTLNTQITDTNAAFFDPSHQYKGCISGIHEVLRRQGLMENILCLSENEVLSPGQSEEIDRVYKDYPDLNDDDFVKENLNKWLG
ncbi:MAG: dihydrodipicolinate synthase family protein [Clostridiales bacterium]|nr:dihydrodipicolinate synthase family protein [Clostridiales bacterium]